jgi:L-methionine (R)-S-oxide reductase
MYALLAETGLGLQIKIYRRSMSSAPTLDEIKRELTQLSAAVTAPITFMKEVVGLLHSRMVKYNWVGFYMIEDSPNGEPVLVLGPFQGAMTPHTRIPLNQGICGAAASTGKTVIVDDVNNDPRYLACSLETKSEIVVPVFVRGRVVGELDIDSHFPAAFKDEDRNLVEFCANLVGIHLETSKA